jgi:hypothetical protein
MLLAFSLCLSQECGVSNVAPRGPTSHRVLELGLLGPGRDELEASTTERAEDLRHQDAASAASAGISPVSGSCVGVGRAAKIRSSSMCAALMVAELVGGHG